jgi:hypothetical protein
VHRVVDRPEHPLQLQGLSLPPAHVVLRVHRVDQVQSHRYLLHFRSLRYEKLLAHPASILDGLVRHLVVVLMPETVVQADI